jgi:hypothetical protein
MAELDIRNLDVDEVTSIRFANKRSNCGGYQANIIEGSSFKGEYIRLADDNDEYVIVYSTQHAKDLIKALEKAIELSWIK